MSQQARNNPEAQDMNIAARAADAVLSYAQETMGDRNRSAADIATRVSDIIDAELVKERGAGRRRKRRDSERRKFGEPQKSATNLRA